MLIRIISVIENYFIIRDN